MKESLKRKIHDVSTYVKANSKRPYGECAIVMVCTAFLVISSVSTDSVNMESTNVDYSAAEYAAEMSIRENAEEAGFRETMELTVMAKDVLPAGGEAKKMNESILTSVSLTAKAEHASDGVEENAPEVVADGVDESVPEAVSDGVDESALEVVSDGVNESAPETVMEDVNESISEETELVLMEDEAAVEQPVEEAAAAAEVLTASAADSTILPEETALAVTAQIPAAVAETQIQNMELDAAAELTGMEVQEDSVEEIDVSSMETVGDSVEIPTAEQSTGGLSATDYDALCRIVEAEAGTEGEHGKLLVANVVLNRVASPAFPGTVESVVTDSGQFSPVSNGSYHRAVATPETVAAVNRALAGENVSMGALYFKSVRSNAEWGNRTLLYNYGNHNFYN